MPIPVITIAQMREWEAATWAAGQTEAEVIRQVGGQIARLARRLTRGGETILLLAGKGHNGDDARAAAKELTDRRAVLLEISSPENDFRQLESRLREKPALVVDGLFGIGLNRSLDGAWLKIIAAVNASKIPALAVDVPSGLNADTGETFGGAVHAAVTLTVGAPTTGLLAQAAWPFVGRLEVAADVGLIPCPIGGALLWTVPEDLEHFPPVRMPAAHKGSFGHAAIVAGSMGYHGAAVLAARGAQRAQPGLVTVFTQETAYHPVAAQLQSAMVKIWRPEIKFPLTTTAMLVGPGLAGVEDPDEIRKFVRRQWRDLHCPLVVDATSLDHLGNEIFPRNGIRVLTPHPGEAARLLNSRIETVQSSRVESLRAISKRFHNCWVVLKGHQTLVGRSEGPVHVNPTGNPHLAQGGSGDALAGFIAGLLAQPALQADPLAAIRHAVWMHGAAADRLQAAQGNWTVEELVDELGKTR